MKMKMAAACIAISKAVYNEIVYSTDALKKRCMMKMAAACIEICKRL